MMKLRFSNSIDIKIDTNTSSTSLRLIESLKSIGFINIREFGNEIEFKSENKHENLESFQRRYGHGLIKYSQQDNNLKVTTITDTKGTFKFSLIFALILILSTVFAFIFKLNPNRTINEILIIGALALSFISEYFINKSLIEKKQHELLSLIEKHF